MAFADSLLGVMQSGMWLQSDIEEHLRQHGLSHGRFSILLAIRSSPDSRLIGNEIASQLGVSKATISKMINRLAAEGYLARGPNRHDLRMKHYSLAPKADTLLDRVIPEYLQRLRLMVLNLKDAEKEALLKILSKISFLDSHKTLLPMDGKTITENDEGIEQIEHYLFSGSQIQRNYCTLFFARRNEWQWVNKAYSLGLIDYTQAYSR